jgi:hypothetical protein
MQHPIQLNFTEQQKHERSATILFMKLWKYQIKEYSKHKEVAELLKSYHINFAMDYIMKIYSIDDEPKYSKEEKKKLTNKIIIFKRENIKLYLNKLIDYLIEAYNPVNFGNAIFIFNEINPFETDSRGINPSHLINFLKRFKQDISI